MKEETLEGLFGLAVVVAVIVWFNGYFNRAYFDRLLYGPLAADLAPTPSLVQPSEDLEAAGASAPIITAPSSERALVSVIKLYASRYQSAPNEMAQSELRQERARAICQSLPSLDVANWVGRVETLSSNSEGLGVLKVRISDRATVGTWDNALSDIGDHTRIPVGSTLHQQAMALHQGESVILSGSFYRSSADCVDEKSLTIAGGMTDPEFTFRFIAIRPAEMHMAQIAW